MIEDTERQHRATMVALGRRFGASPSARERMSAENAKLTWWTRCRRCGEALKGTPDELRAHRCGQAS